MDFLGEAILIDTSAVLALHNSKDEKHSLAYNFFNNHFDEIIWVVLNATKHESYTRARYKFNFDNAINIYDFLSDDLIHQISFQNIDEVAAKNLLTKYKNEDLSFHDALCATIMMRYGLFRVFTFDWHFSIFGFEVFPEFSMLI